MAHGWIPGWDGDSAWPVWVGKTLAWATLLASLLVSAAAWYLTRLDTERDAQRRFDFRVTEIHAAILSRMQAQEQVLRGAGGLFAASGQVTRREWQAYVNALQLAKTYPGILGVGFAVRIAPEEMAGHVSAVRAEGFPAYAVHPAGERPEYTSIVYLEPFDWRNRRAFGYDMFTEPTRRAAMAAARDTGRIRISGKVTLVQETERDVQAGFLMYLPVYRHGMPTDSVEQRRTALHGYAYSPLRMADLMQGILGNRLPDVRLRIHDGDRVTDAGLMYDSVRAAAPEPARQPAFADTRQIAIENRPWTVQITSLPEFEAGIAYEQARIVLLTGVFIGLLMFAIVWSLATLRERAMAIATGMTGALRESREQFRAVAETANDAIVSADSAGRIVYFNRAAERIFGFPAGEALGRPLTDLMPERFRPNHLHGFRRYVATGEEHGVVGHTLELVGRRQDGGEFPLEISVAAWETAQGRFFTGILRDITERYRSESRIRELNAELQGQVEQLAATNRELESFSYTVSHDLRAPLRAVDGFAGMLGEDYGERLDPEAHRLIAVIRDNARRMGLLIDDLLAFSRLGRASVARRRVDMNALVREVLDEIRNNQGHTAEITLGDLPPAWGDGALLRQVWVNLLANAIKFSRHRQPPQVEIGGERVGGETVYFVKDNGVGFDMAHAGQLFGVFQRLHSDADFPGTGVGLAIVHRILEKHGGRIWAEAEVEVDQGATFHFAIPRGDGDA